MAFGRKVYHAMMISKTSLARTAALVLFSLYVITGCRSKTDHSREADTGSTGKSLYDHKVEITYAKGFSIAYFDHFKVVSIISPFDNKADTTKYLLLERGSSRPEGYAGYHIIEIPIRSLAAMSSMHVGLLGFLDSYNILTGLGSLQYVYAPEVNKMIKEGKVQEVGRDQGLNEELLVTMHPDLIMTMGSPDGGISRFKTLEQAGIPVMINSEWVETTPLARAEWVKLAAALLNKESLVNRKFAEIEKEYERLSLLTKQANKPGVIPGINTKDVWFLPGGNSYMARFFEDAGADYHWRKDVSAGSLSLGFETVYPIALQADFWMNVGFDPKDTRKSILGMDSRYADFKALKSGQMYSYNNRVNEKGSNDFFESGNVNPQTVLADLIKIFHPELLPDHKLVYYKKLE